VRGVADLLTVIMVVLFLLSPLAWFQVITKAGYSGWWVFVDLIPQTSMTILWFLQRNEIDGVTFNNYSTLNFWLWVSVTTWLAAWALFVLFSFLAWPALESPGRTTRQGTYSGWDHHVLRGVPRGVPAGLVTEPGGAVASTPQPPSGTGTIVATMETSGETSAVPGWYRSGRVGAGEQSYWDGSAWTACRRWQNNAWVDLPVPAVEDAAVGGGPEPLT
jgi:hypothetical protein